MGASAYELHGDVGKLQNLAGVQTDYRSKFDGILGQFQSSVSTAKGQWSGAGLDGFSAFNTSTEGEFTDLQAAFDKLAAATDNSASNWQSAITRITTRWGA
ncbi:WXG100 family type VII secretion target [Glycomyces salinus]|uniref:WXG100 family type VII secretion target n=1 Tax=Glycomyces salinus TaxID=980294 RepID=UPI0018ECCB7C|nr:hypothetical protein [Glycomyces salinus]